MSTATDDARVALLRAVNVGGRGKLAMADLRTLLEQFGFSGVQTLLQSGNVVFAGAAGPDSALETRLEEAARTRLDLETTFMVRTASQWAETLVRNPFPDAARDDPTSLVVYFTKTIPAVGSVDTLRAWIPGGETVSLIGRDLYVIFPDGQGTSKLTNAVIERHLAVRATARNWNTVCKLAALVAGTDAPL